VPWPWEGVDVALLAPSPDAPHAAASELVSQTGRKVIGVGVDTTSDSSVRQAVAWAVSALGGSIDILVNAAAGPAGFAAPPKRAEITGQLLPRRTRHQGHGLHALRTRGCRRHAGPDVRQSWSHNRLAAVSRTSGPLACNAGEARAAPVRTAGAVAAAKSSDSSPQQVLGLESIGQRSAR